MNIESINLLEEPQTVASDEKSVAIMSRNDLIDNACLILK